MRIELINWKLIPCKKLIYNYELNHSNVIWLIKVYYEIS